MFDYRLGLMTGVDLPIVEIQGAVHQPTIKEISRIGEQDFFIGIQLLCLNKTMYGGEASAVADYSNFQIFMMVLNEKQIADKKASVLQVLSLLFPGAKVIFTPRSMVINSDSMNITIDEGNFEALQKILNSMFCLDKNGNQSYNPGNKKAEEIARKLAAARQEVARRKAQEGGSSGSQLGQYLSILGIGTTTTSLNDTCELTIYQLYDQVERYTLYMAWDLDARARMAGAKPDKPVENWMKNLHE